MTLVSHSAQEGLRVGICCAVLCSSSSATKPSKFCTFRSDSRRTEPVRCDAVRWLKTRIVSIDMDMDREDEKMCCTANRPLAEFVIGSTRRIARVVLSHYIVRPSRQARTKDLKYNTAYNASRAAAAGPAEFRSSPDPILRSGSFGDASDHALKLR